MEDEAIPKVRNVVGTVLEQVDLDQVDDEWWVEAERIESMKATTLEEMTLQIRARMDHQKKILNESKVGGQQKPKKYQQVFGEEVYDMELYGAF